MARDSRIRMRDGLAIPGALLVFYGLLAILYAERFRARSDFCPDSSTILIAGLCYSVWKLILPIVLIGLALLLTGLIAFRGGPEELEGHLHHGTPSHMTLAFLISLVVLPALGWVVQTVRQGDGPAFELTVLGTRFEHTFLLELLVLLGLLMLLPFLVAYIGATMRRRRFLEAAENALDEDPLPHEEGFDYQDTVGASREQERHMVPEHEWPRGRDVEGAVVSCMAGVGGRSCTSPPLPGSRYCADHACSGSTSDGRRCGNMAGPGGVCRVHASATQAL